MIHVIGGARWLLHADGRWMGINIALALVPFGLAAVLFRFGTRRNPLWWAGVALFVAFLPNAPYVLTDVIHLAPSLAGAPSHAAAVLGLLPLYTVLFVLGTASYVGCLRLLARYLVRSGGRRTALAAVAAVHVTSCLGVLLGRQQRLNSWDVLHPARVADASLAVLAHPVSLVIVVVAVAGAALTFDVTLLTLGRAWRRVMPHRTWSISP
jgi:uncharacterized membrane protein